MNSTYSHTNNQESITSSFHNHMTTLADIAIGDRVRVEVVGGQGALRQHFLDMGIIPGTVMELVKFAPMGDPMEFLIHGYELTLRKEDASRISISPIGQSDTESPSAAKFDTPLQTASQKFENRRIALTEHPGLGEGGRFHEKATEHPLPEDATLTFALAGNQNCGKTTLFNQLTGSNQHVGNFPGVTVDRKDGAIKDHPNTDIVDLPGIYSMSPYTSEELVSRQYILDEQPRGIINIVDATNIERNLYLTMQLMELDIPMVLALNMMDELQGNGGSVRVNKMEELLGIPVVPISAVKNQGVDELVDHALHVARYQERPSRQDFCDPNDHGGAVHRCLHAIMHLIEDHAHRANIPLRFAATKVIEGDTVVLERLNLDKNEYEAMEHIITQMEEERGLDRAAAIADMRFSFIEKVVSQTVTKPHESREHERSRQIDKILTGQFTAIPMFILIMGLVFWLTFNVVGSFFQDLVAQGVDILTQTVNNALVESGTSEVVRSLIVDGVFGGVGTVLPIAPIVVTMYFFLSLLEDTGYMARVAFVMDRPLRKIGLSGRSIVPMLMGFGCTVPAVMSTRTLPSERDRKLTVLLTPFMSCSTKLTIYAFFSAVFFPGIEGAVTVTLYALGIVVGIATSAIANHTIFKGEAVPFVMELPNYRIPSIKSVLHLVWDKMADFLQRAFTVVFVASIVVWFLQSFTPTLTLTDNPSTSILAAAAGWMAPVFSPLGFGDWRFCVALICGFMAKEIVVSTLSVLFDGTSTLLATLTPLGAASFLVFCLLYTPCVAAIAVVRRELGGKWAIGIVIFQCLVAWVCAFAVHLIGSCIGIT